MSMFNADDLKTICPPAWVARAYSDYLADCAAIQAQLLGQVTDAISDESLDATIDSMSTTICNAQEQIEKRVVDALIAENEVADATPDWSNAIFVAKYDALVASGDTTISNAISAIANVAPNCNTSALFKQYMANGNADDIIGDSDTFIAAVNAKVLSICTEMNISPESDYTLNEGFIKLKDVLYATISNSVLSRQDEEFNLSLHDVNNTAISSVFNVDEIIEQLKANFASATAWSQGFAALVHENITDAVTAFDSQISNIINEGQEKFASSIAQVRAVIASTKADVNNFIAAASQMLGWNQVADDMFTVVDATDIASYTGASPMTGLNLKTAQGIATAAANTLVAAGSAIWEGIKTIGSRIWSKVRPVVMALTDDPVDLAVQNDKDNSYTVGNFMFTGSGQFRFYTHGDSSYPEITDVYIIGQMMPLFDSILNKWFSMETFFGETQFRITSYWSHQTVNYIRINFDYKYRPKLIDVDKAIDYGAAKVYQNNGYKWLVPANAATEFDNLAKWIDSGELYPADDILETKQYAGLLMSTYISNEVLSHVLSDFNTSIWNAKHFNFVQYKLNNAYGVPYADGGFTPIDRDNADFSTSYMDGIHFASNDTYPSSVTNRDFIRASSGYIFQTVGSGSEAYTNHFFKYIPAQQHAAWSSPSTQGLSIEELIIKQIMLLILQRYDRSLNPTNYVFLPYCNNTYDFSEGRYKIKTDAENKNVAQVLFNAIVVVVVIAVAILIGKQIMKVFKTKRISKMSTYLGQMDNARWTQGKRLSYREQRKYLRYTRKVDKLSGASSGLLGSPSIISRVLGKVGSIASSEASNINWMKTISSGSIQQKNLDKTVSSDVTIKQVKDLIKG